MSAKHICVGVVISCIFVGTSSLIASTWRPGPQDEPTKKAASQAAKAGFPHSWEGQWQGSAKVQLPGGGSQEFTMGLQIKKSEVDPARWSWTVVYDGAAGKQERPYELVEKDVAKGQWEIDERNSIVLPAQLLGDVLWSCFEVQGTTIHVAYRPVHSASAPGEITGIDVEMTSFQGANSVKTGGGTFGEGETKQTIPEVKGHRIGSLQTARMKRVEHESKAK